MFYKQKTTLGIGRGRSLKAGAAIRTPPCMLATCEDTADDQSPSRSGQVQAQTASGKTLAALRTERCLLVYQRATAPAPFDMVVRTLHSSECAADHHHDSQRRQEKEHSEFHGQRLSGPCLDP